MRWRWVNAPPVIRRALGASLAILQRTSNAYTLAWAATITAAAALAFGLAVGAAVFSANGGVDTPAAVLAGLRPALVVVAGLSALGQSAG
jgi:hypothetical protein